MPEETRNPSSPERKNNLTELHRRQGNLSAVLRDTESAVVVVSRDGRILFLNPAAERTLGRNAAELVGRPFGTPLAGGRGKAVIDIVRPNLAVGQAEILVSEGVWSGESVHIVSLHDITELTQAREAQAAGERQLRAHARIIRSIFETFDLEKRLDRILDEMLALVGVEIGGIVLMDGPGPTLPAWRGVSEKFLSRVSRFLQNADPEYLKQPGLAPGPGGRPPRLEDFEKEEGIRTRAIWPLEAPDEKGVRAIVGALVLAGKREGDITRARFEDLAAISDELGLAIAHAQMYRQAQARFERLHVLRRIDSAIIGRQSVEKIVRIVLDSIPKELGAEAVALSLFHEPGRMSVFEMRLPNGTVIHEKCFDLAEDLLAELVDRRQTVIIGDLARDERLKLRVEDILRHALVSYLAVPMVARDEVIGLLHLFTTHKREFVPEAVEFFTTLAGQAAIAVENARLAEELEASLAQYRHVTENAPDVIYEITLTPKPHLTYVNPALRTMLGYGPDEAYAEPDTLTRTVHPEDRPRFEVLLRGEADFDEPHVVRMQHRDGRWVFVEHRLRPEYDDTGRFTGFHAVARDVTLRVQAEEGLKRRAETVAALYQGAQRLAESGSVDEAAHNIVRNCVDLLRARFAWIARSLPDGNVEVMAWYPEDVIYPRRITVRWDDTPEGRGPTGEAIRTGEPQIVPDTATAPGFGPWREAALAEGLVCSAAFPLVSRGRTFGSLNVYSDEPGFFTDERIQLFQTLAYHDAAELVNAQLYSDLERHAADLERRVRERTADLAEAKESAEAASRAKSDFLASMSHELRTPLNAVIGFSEVLRDRYFGELNEKQALYVNDILESGRHLLSLINDILDLSKVEAGKMELDISPVRIADLVAGSRVMIMEKAHRHGIDLEVRVAGEVEDLEIPGDERSLKQVMFNLLSNAVKFTPDGGRIRVTADLTRDRERGTRDEPGSVVISVADSGIGIAPGERDRIFEEFYQVQSGMKDKSPGTGLGLPLTKKLVEMHGGRLWVESEGEGKGSVFSFVLPVFLPKADKDEAVRKRPRKGMEPEDVFLIHLNRALDLSRRHKRPFTLARFHMRMERLKEEDPEIEEILEREVRVYDFLVTDRDGYICLVLQETDHKRAGIVCERFVERLRRVRAGEKISFSLAAFPEDGKSVQELLEKVRTGEAV